MTRADALFTIRYGNRAYHNKESLRAFPGNTPVIASGGRNNGVYGLFAIPSSRHHILTVASTGSAGAAFFHGYPCEVTDDALVLEPKVELSADEMLWYANAINLNRHRFNYGRKVTPERLGSLELPSPIATLPRLAHVIKKLAVGIESLELDRQSQPQAKVRSSGLATISDLFDIEDGNSYSLSSLTSDPSGVNFVSRASRNNGVTARVARTECDPFPAERISVGLSGAGGVLEAFVQAAEFYTAFHVAVLTPKIEMTLGEKLFYCVAIRLHKFRYGFGRQANRTIGSLLAPYPPDWVRADAIPKVQSFVANELRSVLI